MDQTLVDKLYQYIHEDIVSWRLQPGQRLHIAQLAAGYKVGPGPVREALSRLIATELVVAISQRGFRVASVSQADLRDVYQTRTHIEVIALELAMQKGGDEWEGNVIANYHLLAKYEQAGIKTPLDYKEWEERHRNFNLALIGACDLKYLLNFQGHLYQLTERYRRHWLIAGIEASNELVYAKQQKKIMDAALKRDTKLATELLIKHYQNAVDVIESYFQKNKFFNDISGV